MANPKKKFSKIYDKYVEQIYRFVFLKVNSQEVAQDLVSETFLRCWGAFRNKKDIKNPRAFLYQIARNLVIDYYREKGKVVMVSADSTPLVDPREGLEEKTNKNLELERIKNCLTSLKEEYQNAIIWYYLEGLPVSEIAHLLGKNEGATRVLISRALRALKEKISEA